MKDIFRFNGFENLYCDTKGNFFLNDKPIKKVYNNGSLSIIINGSKRGLIKLRKLAYKDKLGIDILPF